MPERTFLADRSGSPRLFLTGPDRAKFLHNLTTNEIKRLPEGQACETFVTNLQGKAQGFGTVANGGDALLFRTDPGGLEAVLPLFAKYGVFDDVAWDDQTAGTTEVHLAGPASAGVCDALRVDRPGGDRSATTREVAEGRLWAIAESPLGMAGITLVGPREGPWVEAVRAWASGRGPWLEPSGWDGLRIEAGTPEFGRDITPDNLPQEIGRDSRAISFVKGCYLGQETVARLDALGHVNKILKGLRFEGDGAPVGASLLSAEGKPCGTVSSSAIGPRIGQAVGLAIVRVAQATAGTVLDWESEGRQGRAIVADLPMIPMASRTPGH